jgi:hypothetical protein
MTMRKILLAPLAALALTGGAPPSGPSAQSCACRSTVRLIPHPGPPRIANHQ